MTDNAALYLLDLDAARREAQVPDCITLVQGGETFQLPAELPLDVFDPLLEGRFDMVGLLKQVFASADDAEWTDVLVDVLVTRPDLPKETVAAVRAVLELLFGAEHFARFLATRPSLAVYTRLVTGLIRAYGVGLGEAFKSLSTSAAAGATSKGTSTASTSSTPEPSGDAQDSEPDSSAPVD